MASIIRPLFRLGIRPITSRNNVGREVKRTFPVTSLPEVGLSRTLSSSSQKHEFGSDGSCPKKQAAENPFQFAFWSSSSVWQRATKNTLRCLLGCSIGDLSMLYALQAYAPDLSLPLTMAASCTAGIATSLALETVVLRVTEDFEWRTAFRTAAGMSMVSMISMELAENAVELWLTGGVATCSSAVFWSALPPALAAGFATPLPFNYYMIRKHGRSCH